MSTTIADEPTIKGNFIVFPGGMSVPLQSCRNPRMILQWSYHLSNREWATKETIKEFIELATRYHGINL